MTNFPCTGCGCCCRRINVAVGHYNVKSKKDPLFFPYKWDENGVCENLTEDNKCKIYENRPLICNVEKFAEYHNLNKKEFYAANIRACNYMMESDGVSPEFRIS